MTAGFHDHFSTTATRYAEFRPRYPDALVDALADEAPATAMALDCGCGNGQLSVALARRFDRVIATDASARQIAAAEPHERVDYRTAPAERSGLADHSVDLVTAAQAAHWFDLPAFHAEARRVCRPGGLVALITYAPAEMAGDAGAVLRHFHDRIIGPHWPAERRHVENGYRDLPFPFPPVAIPALAIEQDWRLDELVGYVDTWSGVRALEKLEGRAAVERFAARLAEAWGPADSRHRVRWPLTIRAGRIDD